MAQIITFPEEVSFEQNPIVVSFRSTNVNRIFQKAIMEATLRTKASAGWYTTVSEEIYSIPLDYSYNVPVRFDLKSLAAIAKPQYSYSPLEYSGIIPRESIIINVRLYEEYLYGGETLYDPPQNSSFPEDTHTTQFNVLPGGLTDYERLSLNKTLVSLIGNICILSRKPEGEIIHPDSYYVIPAVTNLSTPTLASLRINNTTDYDIRSLQLDAYRCFVLRQQIKKLITTHPTAKTIRASISGKTGPLAYIATKPMKAYHFHFVNGFGMMESITCYAREKKTVEIETNENVYIPERNYKSIVSVFTTKSDITENYLLSTGLMNTEWAEWFTTEFFTTNEAYMEVSGNWIPVSIIPDNKITVYDKQKPGMISLDFTVRPQFNGPINDRFVR